MKNCGRDLNPEPKKHHPKLRNNWYILCTERMSDSNLLLRDTIRPINKTGLGR